MMGQILIYAQISTCNNNLKNVMTVKNNINSFFFVIKVKWEEKMGGHSFIKLKTLNFKKKYVSELWLDEIAHKFKHKWIYLIWNFASHVAFLSAASYYFCS